jgi:hypothetical protein
MLDDLIRQSNIIEIADSSTQEGEDSSIHQVTLKVLDEKRWIRMMVDLLSAAHFDDEFDLEPRKSFWFDAETDKAKFSWVLLVWGDLEAAASTVGDILSRRHEPKPPPPKTEDPRMQPTKRTTLKKRRIQGVGEDGERIVTTARLPHAQVNRYSGDPHETVKVARGKSRRVRATVAAGTDFSPAGASKEPGL